MNNTELDVGAKLRQGLKDLDESKPIERKKIEASILSKLETLLTYVELNRHTAAHTVCIYVADDLSDIIHLVKSLDHVIYNPELSVLEQENFELQKELLNQALAFDELQKKSVELLEHNKQLQDDRSAASAHLRIDKLEKWLNFHRV